MLVTSLLLMGLATFAIGLLPTYASIGIAAPILLLACRLVQGFAVGGEWGGAVLMAAEHGDDSQRGFWSSWPQAGVALGNLFATGVLWILAAVQSDAAFKAWGWRIPFLLSAVLVVDRPVGAPLDRGVPGLHRGQGRARDQAQKPHLPLFEVIRKYPRRSWSPWACAWPRTSPTTSSRSSRSRSSRCTLGTAGDKALILKALLIGSVVHFVTIPLIGALSDRVGRRPLYLAGAVGVAAWSWVFFDLIATQVRGQDPARDRRRPGPARADVRPAGGVLLRALRHLGPLHRRLRRLPAGLDLRRRAGPDHRHRAARRRERRRHQRARWRST